jgi:hypothetical protein
MARRAVSPRHGLITGLGPVSVPIFTHAGRRSRGIDDSYVCQPLLPATIGIDSEHRDRAGRPLRNLTREPSLGP